MVKTPRILLINPPSDCVVDDRVEPPLGLLYLAGTLIQNSFDSLSLYDMTGCQNREQINAKIQNIPVADIYGIGCYSTNYAFVKQIIKYIKENNRSAYILVGGPHPTGLPDFTIEDSGTDAIVVGEGEDVFGQAVGSFLESRQTGVLYGKGRSNIDSYAFPTRGLVDFNSYSRKLMGETVVSLLSSRGCKHHCIHCNSVVMGGGNRNVRYRSTKNIIEEIESLRDKYPYYRFNDDHFTGNPNLEELLISMKDLDIKFRIFARIEDLDNRTSELLKEAGCVHVNIGLESLNPRNLRILGKASQIGKEGNVQIAKGCGLVVRSSFMVGLPYDNDQTITESFQRAAELGLDEFAIYPLIPYPGTLIWKNPERFGYTITNRDFTQYVQMGKDGEAGYFLKHKNFTPEDVRKWFKMSTRMFKEKGVLHMSESRVAE